MNTTAIDKNANTAAYIRPEWMSDEQWATISAEMTERWLTLLDDAARQARSQMPAVRGNHA